MKGLFKSISCLIALLLVVYIVLYYPAQNRRSNLMLKKWKECMLENLEAFMGNYEEAWNPGWGQAITKCGQGFLLHLNISAFRNRDETKYHILPKGKSKSTLVTLGVGKDTKAEKALQEILGKDNVEFFGADPIYDENDQLYSEIGKFFPFAVSATAGYSTASVYINNGYRNKPVVNVDLIYFLTKMINQTFYDAIWMDAENAEYELFPSILMGDLLDQNDVTVCQWNMEIHNPNLLKKKLAYDFLLQTVRDGRYGFFNHFLIAGHYRLFFLNFEDKRCLEKYVPDELLLS